MKLYVNTIPFRFSFTNNIADDFLPVGTTFVAVGADLNGVVLKLANDVNKNGSKVEQNYQAIHPEMIKLAFKEVEQVAI